MALFHLDTSALVKYYVLEPGSTWVRTIVDATDPQSGDWAHAISIADIGVAETAAAFAVLHRTGRIRHSTWLGAFDMFIADLADRLLVVDTNRRDFVTAAFLTRTHPLRAYDAVQLAVALRYQKVVDAMQGSLTFVSGDRTLLTAATAEGLFTDNPFDHTSHQDMAPPPLP